MRLRPIRIEDRPYLRELLESTREFTADEVNCAIELIEDAAQKPGPSGYWGRVAAGEDDRPLAYAIYGPTPMTDGTFDLYWIATRPDLRGKGVGKRLLEDVERDVLERGGHLVRIETSAQDAYGPTRHFYAKTRYVEVGHIPNFYKPGDDLVILAKELDSRRIAQRPDRAA